MHLPCGCGVIIDLNDPALLLGRRWDAGWSLAVSLSRSSSQTSGDGYDSVARWTRLRAGRALVRDGRWTLWLELEGANAWSEWTRGEDPAVDGVREWRETWSGAARLRPEARIWRELRVSTSIGLQRLRTERVTTTAAAEGARTVSRTVVEGWSEFGDASEYDLTFVWSF